MYAVWCSIEVPDKQMHVRQMHTLSRARQRLARSVVCSTGRPLVRDEPVGRWSDGRRGEKLRAVGATGGGTQREPHASRSPDVRCCCERQRREDWSHGKRTEIRLTGATLR